MEIIKVENLSKEYLISHQKEGMSYLSLRDELVNSIRGIAGFFTGKKNNKEKLLALNGVSFTVQKGETLGIIGSNGAGKSTLLKILTRITPPTKGRAIVKGSVGSLLEVGTGFHPELTGRENIYLNGSILGMKRKEIESKFDEIVDFAGVRRFLDTPVKRYSSGMIVRLAFAVASHLEPDILLIDEVLSVGDAAFQKKSFKKMEEITSKDNKTILFVSHNLASVRDLCDRCILLEQGQIKMIGKPDDVINAYLEVMSKEMNKRFPINLNELPRKAGGSNLRMTYLDVEGGQDGIVSGKEMVLKLGFEKKEEAEIDDLVVGLVCFNNRQEHCFMLRNDVYKKIFSVSGNKGYIKIKIPRLPLGEGQYSLDIQLMSLQGAHQGSYDWIESGSGIDFYVNQGDFYGTDHAGFPNSASMFLDSEWDILTE